MIRLKCVLTLLLGILLSFLPIAIASPQIDDSEPKPSTTTPPTASWIPKFFKQQLDLLNKVLAESGAAPIDKEDVGKIFASNNATSAAPTAASSLASGVPPVANNATSAAPTATSGFASGVPSALSSTPAAASAERAPFTALPASFHSTSTAPLAAPSLSSPAPSFAEATGTTPAATSKGPADALREMLAMFNLSSQAPASANNTATTALPAAFNSMTTAPPASSNLPFPSAPSSPEASATPEATMSSGIASQMPADHGNGSTTSGSVEFSSQTRSVISATESSSLLSPAAETMTSAQPATGFSNEGQQPHELANVTGSQASKAAATTAAQQLNGEFSTVTPSAALEGSTMPEYPAQQAATKQPSRLSTSISPQVEAPTEKTTSSLPAPSGETTAPGELQRSITPPSASAEAQSAEPSKEALGSTRSSTASVSASGFEGTPGSNEPTATGSPNLPQEGTQAPKQQNASEGFTTAPSQEVSWQSQGKHTTLPFSRVSSATATAITKERLSSHHLLANVTATKSPSKASSANVTGPHVQSSFNATKSHKPALNGTSEEPSLITEQPPLVSPSASPQIEAPTEENTSAFPMASGEKTASGALQQSITTPATSAEAQSVEPSIEALGSTRSSAASVSASGSEGTPGPNGPTVTNIPGLQNETATRDAQQQETPESSPAAASHEVSGQFQGKHTTLPFSRVSGASASVANEGQRPSSHLMANVTATKIPSKASSANATIPHVESLFNATKSHKPPLSATSMKPSLTTEHPLVSPSASPQIEAPTEENTSAFPFASGETTAIGELQQLATTPATSGETQPSAHSKEALRSTRATAVPESAAGSAEAHEPGTKPANESAATVFPNQQNEAATQAAQQQNASEDFTAAPGQEASGPFQGKLTTLPFSGISGATESATSIGRLSSSRLMANVTATKSPHKASSANVTMPHVESFFNATKGKKPTLNGTSEAPSLTSEHPPLVSPSGSPQIEALTEENGSASPIASGEQTAAGKLLQSITRPATSAEAQSEEPSNEALGSTRPPEVSGPAVGSAGTAGPNGPTAASLSSLQNEAATQFAHQHTVSEGLLAAASHGHSGPFQGKHTTLPFSGVPTFATGLMVSSGQQSSSHLVANVTVTKSPHKASFANVTTPHVQSSFNATTGSISALNKSTKEQPLVSPSASPELEASAEAVTSSFPVASKEKTAPGESELVTPPSTSALAQSAELINDATGSISPSVTGSSEPQGRHTTARSGASNASRQPNLQHETAIPETIEPGASEPISSSASQEVSGQFQGRQTTLSLSQQEISATGTTMRFGQLLSSLLMSNVTTSNRPRKAISANTTTPHVQSALSASKGSNKPALSGIATEMPLGVSVGTENQTAKPDLSAEQSASGFTAEPASAANVTRPHVESSFNATKGRKPSAGNATESPMQSTENTASNKPAAEQSIGGATAAPAKAGLGGQNAEWKGTAPPGQELPQASNEGSQAEGGITPAPARGGIGGGEAPWKGTAPPGQAIPQGGNQSAQISNPTALPALENTIETTQNESEAQTGIVKAGRPFGSTRRMANVTAAPLWSGVSPDNVTGTRAFGREGANGAPFQEFSEASPQFVSPGMPNVTASPKSPGIRPNVTRPNVQGSRNATGARNTTNNSSITLQPGQEPSNTTGTVESEEEESKVVTAGPARGGLGGQQSAWKGTAPPGQQLPPRVAQGGPSAGKEAAPKPARGGIGGGQAPWKGTAPPDLAFPSGASSLESVDNASVSSIAPAPSEASALQIANGTATAAAQGRVKSGFSKNFTKSPISGNQTAVTATTGQQSNDTSSGQLTSNETLTNPAGGEITAAPARGGVGGGQGDWKGTAPPGQQLPPQVAHGGPKPGEEVTPRPASGGIGGGEAPWKGTPPPGQAFPQGGRSQESADNSSFSSQPEGLATTLAPSQASPIQLANGSATTAGQVSVKSGFSKNVTKSPVSGNVTASTAPEGRQSNESATGNLTSNGTVTKPAGNEVTAAPARGGVGGGQADWKGTAPPGQQLPPQVAHGGPKPGEEVTPRPASGGIGGGEAPWKGTAPPGQAFLQGGRSQESADNASVSSRPKEIATSIAPSEGHSLHPANGSAATTEPGRVKSGFSKNATKSPPGGNHTAVSEPPAGNLTSKEMGTTPSGSEGTEAPARGGIGGGEADWKGTPPPGQQFPGPQEPVSSVTGAPASQLAFSHGGGSQQSIDNSTLSSQLNESAISGAANVSKATTEPGRMKSAFSKNRTQSPPGGNQTAVSEPPTGNLTSMETAITPSGNVATGAPVRGGIGGGEADWKGTPPPGQQFPGPQEPLANVTGAPANGGIGGGQSAWKGTAPPGQALPQGGSSQQSIDNSTLSSQLNESVISRASNVSTPTTEQGRVKSGFSKNATKSPPAGNHTAVSKPSAAILTSNEMSTTPTGSEATGAPAKGGVGGGQADWKGTPPPGEQFPGSQEALSFVTGAPASGGIGGVQSAWKGTAPPGQAFPQQSIDNTSLSSQPNESAISRAPNGSEATTLQGLVKSSGGRNATKSPASHDNTTVTALPNQRSNESSPSNVSSGELTTVPPGSQLTAAPARGGVGGGQAEWKGTAPPGQAFPQGKAASTVSATETSLQSAKGSATTAAQGRVKSSGGKNVTTSPASQSPTASTVRQGQQSNDRSTTPTAFAETATAPPGSENTGAPARGGIGGGQADWKGTAPPGQAFPQSGRNQESIDDAHVSSQPGEASMATAPSANVTSARPLNGSATAAEQGRVKSSGGKNVTKSPTGQNETGVSKPSGHQLESEPSTSHLASTDLGTTPSGGEITGAPAKGGVGGGPADWKGTPPTGRQFPGPQEQLPLVAGAPARGGIGGVQSAWKGMQPPLPQAQLSASTANPNPLSGAAAFTQPQETLPHTGSLPQHPTVPSETPSRPSKTPGPVVTAPGERLITAPPAAPAGPAGPIRPTQGPAQKIGQPPIERPSLPEEPSLPSHGGARPTNSNENAPRQPVPVPPSSTDQPESQLLQILINLWEDGRKRA